MSNPFDLATFLRENNISWHDIHKIKKEIDKLKSEFGSLESDDKRNRFVEYCLLNGSPSQYEIYARKYMCDHV